MTLCYNWPRKTKNIIIFNGQTAIILNISTLTRTSTKGVQFMNEFTTGQYKGKLTPARLNTECSQKFIVFVGFFIQN